ncbi:DNA cytosine methyltransferase [Lactiplantibacillus plantarum]
MRFIDMFAGIGGFHLGMDQAGHQCVGWVEWDKFARQSYQAIHNVKGMWNASDIRTVRASELPRADCWCFGFPCQDISVAGKQKGFTAGKRSSLFFTVTGLIRDLEEEDRPSYLLIENVKNLLSINRGLDFLKLQIELDEIGYDVEWDVLDSAEVVPQHRERIFIVGHLRGRRTRKVFPIIREDGEADKPDKEVNQIGNISNSKSFGGNPQVTVREATKKGYDVAKLGDSINFSQPNSKTRRGRVGHDVANTLTTAIEQATLTDDLKIRKLTPLECWRLQGFPDWAFDRAKQAGLSDSQLYKQAGNSVTVPVIKAIAERMKLEENK